MKNVLELALSENEKFNDVGISLVTEILHAQFFVMS